MATRSKYKKESMLQKKQSKKIYLQS